jgi:lysophospholipase L1-like esterase
MGIGVPQDENFGGVQQQNFPENPFLYGDGIHFSREGHQIIGKTAME